MAADGSIWAVGNVLSNRRFDPPDADPKGGAVRHFDRSGKLIESFFPYASLNDRVRVAKNMGTWGPHRIGSDGFLQATLVPR